MLGSYEKIVLPSAGTYRVKWVRRTSCTRPPIHIRRCFRFVTSGLPVIDVSSASAEDILLTVDYTMAYKSVGTSLQEDVDRSSMQVCKERSASNYRWSGAVHGVVNVSACILRLERPLLEWLVQLFVDGTCYVPQTARRLLAPGDLPPALERVAMRAQRCSQTWFAWADGSRTWFVVAEIARLPARYRRRGAIRMFFYDEDGRLVAGGTWVLHPGRNWILCGDR